MQEALRYLIEENKYYRANNVHLNQDALQQLPEDGNWMKVRTLHLPECEREASTDQSESSEDQYESHLSSSFIPNATQHRIEQETVEQSLQDLQSGSSHTLIWPTIGGAPINEFTTEGYFSMAFPTLYPTRAADFLGQRCNHVTISNYFTHLLKYGDGRFARHPRFRFFALSTEMRWRALQAGRIYVKQHPGDAQLTVDELRDMIGREGEAFSNSVLHYASSLRGTRQYWFKQRSRLISMVDTLGLPTILFTHSAADLQWPELARLICPEDLDSSSTRIKAVNANPALADWFFYHRVQKFMEVFYQGVLQATDYWMRFEWQHRGSPHVHGVAWLPNAPDVEQLFKATGNIESVKEDIIQYANRLVSTINPAVAPDGSNVESAPQPVTQPHICSKSYLEVQDHNDDLSQLIATSQRNTRCSEAYCLRTRHGKQACRFIRSHCNLRQPLSPKMSPPFSQLVMMG